MSQLLSNKKNSNSNTKPEGWMEFKEPHTGLVKNDFFGYWYLQYCLVTGLYMLEPWERKLFNSFVFALMNLTFVILYVIYRWISY